MTLHRVVGKLLDLDPAAGMMLVEVQSGEPDEVTSTFRLGEGTILSQHGRGVHRDELQASKLVSVEFGAGRRRKPDALGPAARPAQPRLMFLATHHPACLDQICRRRQRPALGLREVE